MNILYLSALGGGLDTNVRLLAPALVKAGHRVSVLYIDYPGASTNGLNGIEGVEIHHATIRPWHYYFQRATFGMTSLTLNVRSIEFAVTLHKIIESIHHTQKIDIFEIPEIFITPRLLPHSAYVVRLHGSAWMFRRLCKEPTSVADGIEKKLEAVALNGAAGITAPSSSIADYIRQALAVGDKPIEIIPYPIDTARFKPIYEKPIHPIILFVGRIEKRKGADVLMTSIPRVLSEYPNCEFVFAGRVADELKSEVMAISSTVKFLGIRPREELIEWYQNASVFVAPSIWDNSPNTIYEAMACGTPVIASCVGGIPELVDEGMTGLLVPPSDSNALSGAIIKLLDNEIRRKEMGRRGREKALAKYSLIGILEQTVAYYERVLNSNANE